MRRFGNVLGHMTILGLCLLLTQVIMSQDIVRNNARDAVEIRVGYMSHLFSGVAQKDAEAAVEVWAKKFIEDSNMNYRAKGIVYDGLADVERAISQNALDLVALDALEFLSVRNNPHFEPVLMAARGETIMENMILVVRSGSGVGGLPDLESKALKILPGTYGRLGLLWLDTVLMKNGLPECEAFFDSIETVDKPSSALLPVFFSQADACIVTRTSFMNATELNPQIGGVLDVLVSSPDLVLHVMCLRRSLGTEHKNNILKIIGNLKSSSTGSQILMLFSTKRLFDYDAKLLRPVELLLEEYSRWKSRQKKTRGFDS